MNSHEIARELLNMPPKELVVSVDISTCDKDAGGRVFTSEYYGINDTENDSEVVLLFAGSLNS